MFHYLVTAALALLSPTLVVCKYVEYEVWAADQSNTAPGQAGLALKGGLLWIWKGSDMEKQVADPTFEAKPLPCSPSVTTGPCDLLDMFPQDLIAYSSGASLGSLPGFGRFHGVQIDPFNRYVAISMFTPGGGYVGIVDTQTREAIALFRATRFQFKVGGNTQFGRSVHMNFWSKDGKTIIVSNLEGRAVERIHVDRVSATDSTITGLTFDKSATIGLATDMAVVDESDHATFFKGRNALGNDLIGAVMGDYSTEGLSNLTPQNVCKENGCGSGPDGALGGRTINTVICPITSTTNRIYTTLTGGGMFVIDFTTTPMSIVGEYGKQVIYGAGCGGIEAKRKMFINTGVLGAPAGGNESMFAIFAFHDDTYPTVSQPENTPLPDVVFEDPGNTATNGNLVGPLENLSGQKLGVTTRRDSHGASLSRSGRKTYVHVVDRIQGNMEVVEVGSYSRSTYDLISKTGRTGVYGKPGACAKYSVPDFSVKNDPAPDLMTTTPDWRYILVGLRGPAPSTFSHSGQGSCPGVGVIQLSRYGFRRGKLVTVLPTTNTVPDNLSVVVSAGGTNYTGTERSDVHQATIVLKQVVN